MARSRGVLTHQLRERSVNSGGAMSAWKVGRLSRSLKDLLHLIEQVGESGADFRPLAEATDTTTPAERMMMQMVCSFAEFARAMTRERSSVCLALAREGHVVAGGES